MSKCRTCGRDHCYAHCQESESGQHEINWDSASVADGYAHARERFVVIDVNCKFCGVSASAKVEKSDFIFE